MRSLIYIAKQVAEDHLANISVDDVLSLADVSTKEAEQIIHLIQIAEVKL